MSQGALESTTSLAGAGLRTERSHAKEIKCVVWDLDETLWHGVLLEQSECRLREGVREAIATLDARGILQSVASRNDHAHAMGRLEALGLNEYFLYPQINWGPKSASLRAIADKLNIGLDTLALIDDQPFERDEVRFASPEVMCIDAAELSELTRLPELNPRFITEDSQRRRKMYLADIERKQLEEDFSGPQEEFLESLSMVFSIFAAKEDDLKRVEELTIRTNQLNTTGYAYSYEQLDGFRSSPDHWLLVAGLDDKYGTYGKIGVALVEKGATSWNLRLLLMSCRVLSRGVGSLLINHVREAANAAGVPLLAEMITTDRNRMMHMTYRFLGFTEISANGAHLVLQAPAGPPAKAPHYVRVVTS
jgi:FkbH-like protein